MGNANVLTISTPKMKKQRRKDVVFILKLEVCVYYVDNYNMYYAYNLLKSLMIRALLKTEVTKPVAEYLYRGL